MMNEQSLVDVVMYALGPDFDKYHALRAGNPREID
jgi:hypothetical protein